MIQTEYKKCNVTDGPKEKSEMQVFVARPVSVKTAPVLMVLQEAFGVNHHIRDVCQRFAREGYLTVSPEFFHRTAPAGYECAYGDFKNGAMPHISALTVDQTKNDLQATYDLIINDPQADRNRVACIGYCMGGRAAYLANSFLPIRAAASYYGGRISPDLLPLASDQKAPILLVWGGLDAHIGPSHQRALADALKSHKKSFVELEFSDADHGFFCEERPAYNAKAARTAWAVTLQFLKENLSL